MKSNCKIVLHIPHASTTIPPKLRSRLVLSDEALASEVIAMTDLYTDELFALPQLLGQSVSFPISRLVVDPERFLDDILEPMASLGMGVIYTRTSEGAVLRNTPSAEERAELIAEFYTPHHEALTRAVDSCLDSDGVCLILDCHSFPQHPLPYEHEQETIRPDICLGTDSFHTPSWLGELAQNLFHAAGYSVAFNRPFPGALVPAKHHGVTPAVYSLMVEINRGLYMDCSSGYRSLNFLEFKNRFQGILTSLIDEVVVRMA